MISQWSAGLADDNMAEEILLELGGLVRQHPWWRARSRLVLDLLGRLGVAPPARILDVGCGWGTTLDALEARGYSTVGADISSKALRVLDRPGRELAEFDLTVPLLETPEKFDAVLALDVIEHLDDDRSAVARLNAFVKPGGLVIVSVPALTDLWSEFDTIQGHRRRYLPESLTQIFDGSGLELSHVFWWGSWLVPMLRRSRIRPRSRPGESIAEIYRGYLSLPRWPGSLIIRGAFALEQNRAIEGKLKLGTSLFAIARRRD